MNIRRLPSLVGRLGWDARLVALLLAVLLLAGLLEPWLPPAEYKAPASGPRRSAPGAEFLFGTDSLGRSVLARTIEGIRLTFVVSATAVTLAGIVGSIIGMAAAYMRGVLDPLIAAVTNVMFAFPAIIFGLLVTAILGPGTTSAIAAIFFVVLPTMIRVSRSATMTVIERDFVIAAEISGASPSRILRVHIAPNIAAITVVQLAYMLSIGMIVESALSYLGLGVQPPTSSLGTLLRENSAFIVAAPWLVLAPGAVLAVLIFSVNYLGDYARGLLDPVEPRALA
ncbi:MAG: ABC transporter permease [Rhodobacteraceae bacterium]|nr:ABC transporter permease [Paracoccaceae bacterium]